MQVPANALQCTIFPPLFCSLVLGQSPDLSGPKSAYKPCTNLFFFRNSAGELIYYPTSYYLVLLVCGLLQH
ncbi:hypothetical protein C8F04DRAFT_1126464 [Mycena alexandri]|uniref:Uncharacterized protein n=1 Tax=Mycena alexandri TaxID=1745969 RepID=A0AAD6S8U7_9AGAR|nr:hypothetical protein C8F04DRAFT_1135655 [Mycena alexandri]KAJ7026049.1 hypothetical protein C8F04DRAFT_1126464 [Mycena alexandri]